MKLRWNSADTFGSLNCALGFLSIFLAHNNGEALFFLGSAYFFMGISMIFRRMPEQKVRT